MPSGRFVYAAKATLLDRLCPLGRALDEEAPVLALDVVLGRLEQVGGDLLRLVAQLARRSPPWPRPATGVERLAYVPRPYGVLSVSPSCTSTSSGGIPSSSATIWANVVSWPWPCDLTPSLRIALPVGWMRSSAESNILQAGDVVLLAGTRADDLGERCDPDADAGGPPRGPAPARSRSSS